jgi:hypothetical protein
VIEGEPLAGARNQLQAFGVPIPVDLEAGTRFDAREDGDEPFGDPVFLSDFQRDLFFVGLTGGEVGDGALPFFSATQGGFSQLFGEALSVGPKLFQEDIPPPEQAFESVHVSNGTKGSAQDQSVKSAQNPSDLVGMFCYKTFHGVLLKEKFPEKPFYLLSDAVSIFNKRFGCG